MIERVVRTGVEEVRQARNDGEGVEKLRGVCVCWTDWKHGVRLEAILRHEQATRPELLVVSHRDDQIICIISNNTWSITTRQQKKERGLRCHPLNIEVTTPSYSEIQSKRKEKTMNWKGRKKQNNNSLFGCLF